MKKPVKFSIFFLLVVSGAFTIWCYMPYYYSCVMHARIKQGMPINDVLQVLTDAAVKPTLCQWRHQESQEYFSSNRNECRIPDNIDPSRFKTELTVLFMGPGFLHNDFTVNFEIGGSVSDVSELKHWD